MPDWLDRVTFGQVWETIVWAGAVVGGAWWIWSRAKPLLLRIEAKADSADATAKQAVANTQSDGNGGHSPHDQLVKKVDCIGRQLEQITHRLGEAEDGVIFLTDELHKNHPPENRESQ